MKADLGLKEQGVSRKKGEWRVKVKRGKEPQERVLKMLYQDAIPERNE